MKLRALLILSIITALSFTSCGTDDDNVLNAEPQAPVPRPVYRWQIQYHQYYSGNIPLTPEFCKWFENHKARMCAHVPNHNELTGKTVWWTMEDFNISTYPLYNYARIDWWDYIDSPTRDEALALEREFSAFTDTTHTELGYFSICTAVDIIIKTLTP